MEDEETRLLKEKRAQKLKTKPLFGAPSSSQNANSASSTLALHPVAIPPKRSLQEEIVKEVNKRPKRLSLVEAIQPVKAAVHTASNALPWFLSLAESVESTEVESDDFIDKYGPKSWEDLYALSSRIKYVNGPRNQFRQDTFALALDVLETYVKGWKSQSLPLLIKGDTGSGKTRCLQLIAKYTNLECVCLHELFLDAYTKEELREKLCGLGSKGLSCTPKLWVIEHVDTLNETVKNMVMQAIPMMMKTGAVVCTSWPSSAEQSKKFIYLEFLPWTTASKQLFLHSSWIPATLRKHSSLALKECGENIASTLALAQLWGHTLPPVTSEQEEEENLAHVPVNCRTLVEESFTERWCTLRSLALESSDSDVSIQLVQEMIPMALNQGRCKKDMDILAQSFDALSSLDSCGYTSTASLKLLLEQSLLQKRIRSHACGSLEKFNSGSSLPIPQSFLHRYGAAQKISHQTIHKCRGEAADTRYFSEDVQLFLQASKNPWKSPYSIK
jgi:hypothetical protein